MADRQERAPRIDPRFDPKFQPGYDPQTESAASRAMSSFGAPSSAPGVEVVPGSSASVVAVGGASGPAVVPVSTSDPRLAPASPPVPGFTPAPGFTPVPDLTPVPDSDEPRPVGATLGRHRRNPFLLALWAISAVLVVSSVILFQALDDLNRLLQTSADVVDFSLYQVAVAVVPMLFMTGIATAIGLLSLHAVIWARRGPG